MAVSGLGFTWRPQIALRPPLLYCLRRVQFGSVAAIETLDEPESVVQDSRQSPGVSSGRGRERDRKAPQWKKLNAKELGLTTSMISEPTRRVLNMLRRKGYEAYLVGGCVRDLILKRTPKDFDVITTAELKEVKRVFSWCQIIGKRFPICHVHIDDTVIEVSSFSTAGSKYGRGLNYEFERSATHDDEDFLRWRDCLRRDFTINGLIYDPFRKIVYDYLGGIEDIRKAKVQTVIPANSSFSEDCARILRAIRIAARLGFKFSRETAHFVKNLSPLIQRLDKSRLLMEMNYMLAYGSAEASLRLLWKFGLLELLLPFKAAYFVRHGFRRRDERTNMLLSLFSHLDRLLAPDRPCHGSLWVGILAFHEALCERPRDPLVVAVFSLAVHNGGDLLEALGIAGKINKPHESSFYELAEPQNMDSQTLIDEVKDLAASIKIALCKMNDEYSVSQAMSAYPQAPFSDLVFISLALYLQVCKLFECVTEGPERRFIPKQGKKINYESLEQGSLQELRHIFARVVFDTVFPLNGTSA